MCQQVIKAVAYNIIEVKKTHLGETFVVSLPFYNQNGVKIITVDYTNATNKFTCECEYFQKSGIGCCHIMKALIHAKKSIIDFGVGPEWRI